MPPSIEAAIEARALGFGALTALIGTNPVRFYPLQAQQGTNLPYVTYQVIDHPPYHLMGADKEAQPRIQFDIWASSWAIARQVRDQLKACFDRWSGTFASTTVDASICENGGMQVEPEDTTQIKRMTMEFIMTYQLI